MTRTGGDTGQPPAQKGQSSLAKTLGTSWLGSESGDWGWGGQRGRHSSCHSSSSSTICPFPALAANPNHFLLGRLRPLPAAWPCTDPEGQRTILSSPALTLEAALPSTQHLPRSPKGGVGAEEKYESLWRKTPASRPRVTACH